jgi:hypothetical protein
MFEFRDDYLICICDSCGTEEDLKNSSCGMSLKDEWTTELKTCDIVYNTSICYCPTCSIIKDIIE